MNRLRCLLWLAMMFCVTSGYARAMDPEDVPEPLRPWIKWVMHGDEQRLCPFAYNNGESRRCAWPGKLALQLQAGSGRFQAHWRVYTRGWITLPGNAEHWPQNVAANGKPAVVIARQERPVLELEPGEYRIEGALQWDELPESFQIPAATGLVDLTINGKAVPFPDISPQGQVWVKRRGAGEEASRGKTDSLTVQVFRRVIDEVPLRVVTHIDLQVAGKQREVVFAAPLLPDFIPLSINSGIPAQLQPDGRLRVQVRPGRWTVRIDARAPRYTEQLTLAATGEPWPADEIWVFDARNHIRLLEVAGLLSVDPRQTNLPKDWRRLPAYRLQAGDTMGFHVIRRGDPEPEPDKLNLTRTLWLDFDGGGYTINDAIDGSMTQGWRLEAGKGLMLGRVVLNGEPQFITTRSDSGRRGVEVRRGGINLSADSRWQAGIRTLPAVGWDHDFQSLHAVLNLPPGWTLFSASGIDEVKDTWIKRWTLLDLFLVLIVAMAIGHLWGWRRGVLAVLTLALIWHEPGAPRVIWIHILIAIALLRVVPTGKLRFVVTSYRNVSLLVLLAITIPFLVNEIRTGFYPQLERPWQAPGRTARLPAADKVSTARAMRQEQRQMSMMVEDIAPEEALPGMVPESKAPGIYSLAGKRRPTTTLGPASKLAMIDPLANVQTGPGVPRWQWTSVPLTWNGPVAVNQTMSLKLLSPRVNFFLALLRVALLTALGVGIVLASRTGQGFGSAPGVAPVIGLFVLLPILSMTSTTAYADFPSENMLKQLKTRLSEPAECLPACAQVPRMKLEISPAALVIRMQVLAAKAVSIPLPAHVRHWLPTDVALDGQSTDALFRTPGNALWLRVSKGRHQVLLSGPLPARNSLDLPLPLRPRYVEISAGGWSVDGVHEDGLPDGQLQLTRVEAGDGRPSLPELEAAPLPPFVRVERTLQLGLDWRVQTRVVRVSPPGTAVVIEVPLLAGESVTTGDIHVIDNNVQVNMSARQQQVRWSSALEKTQTIDLVAPATTAWTEVWRLDVSPIWHAVASGLAVVHHQDPGGQWLPEWQPWPGETVTLSVTRPAGVEGRTLTIDHSNLRVRPGKRATDADLQLTLRSSQGVQHTITLPEDARLQAVTVDGTAQPIRQKEREVTLPLHPGTQQVVLSWRQPRGIMSWFVSPVVDLATDSVNASINVTLGRDRWVLLTGGPSLGPAVLFWGVLIVIALLAIALGKVTLTPLTSISWLLLLIGLSQVDIWLALIVVGWLLALGLRARLDGKAGKIVFNLSQVALAILTIAALMILFQAIQHGLLGTPDMQIAGNGSSAHDLLWYQDRADSELPRAWLLSAPLMAYRLLMLAWALWLAFALLRWLRWAWTCYSSNGLWRPFSLPVRKPGPPPPGGEPA